MRTVKATITSILTIGLLAGSAVGVAAQDEADAVAWSSFYGTVVGETDAGMVIEMTDPRASGELSVADTRTELRAEDNLDHVVWTPTSARLVNENGSWSGTGTNVSTPWDSVGGAWLLTGEGDYTGLVMILGEGTGEHGDHDLWGAIVPTDVIPPYPELPAE